MRWLVPSAAAIWRRLCSPTPCSATWSTAAASRRSFASFTEPDGTCTIWYMALQRLDARGHSDAEPATVYALLRDGSTWPAWGTVERFALEQPGTPAPESVGAIRNFFTGRYKMRERVAELVPDKRFSYELLDGLPLRDYRAVIDITPADGGTAIHWHTTFTCKVPGMGWLYRRALQKVTTGMVDGLVAYTVG